jgi:hypothetical protein
MKHCFKNYLKLGVLLFGISCFVISCQKEDDEEVPINIALKKKANRISLKELNAKLSTSNNYNSLSQLFDVNRNLNSQFSNRLDATQEPWLMTDEIVMIEKADRTFYTFRIGTNTNEVEFYNLVVSVAETGEIETMRILEYTPSESWLEDSSLPFSGTVSVQENELFSTSDLNNIILSRSSGLCVTEVTGEWLCNKGENHAPWEGTTCTAWEYIITLTWGPCPEVIDAGDSDGGDLPIDGGNTGGGSGDGGSNDTNNPPDGDEDCLLDANGNCIEDETVVLTPKTDKKNCNELNKMLEDYPVTPPFKSIRDAIIDLKNVLNGTPQPINEQGYSFANNISNVYKAAPTSNNTINTVNYNNAANIFGGGHLHQDDGKSIPMFSGQDLFNLLDFYNQYNPGTPVDPSIFTLILVSHQGVYAIKINDITKLQALQSILDDEGDANNDEIDEYENLVKKIERRYQKYDSNDYSETINGSPGQYQKELLKFMDDYDGNGSSMGISLYKADAQLTKWNKLTIDNNNTVESTPCNE